MIRIFEVEEGELKVTENCLMIKELKAIMDASKDYMPTLKFVHLMTTPDSPFANLPEEDVVQAICEELGATFSLEDKLVAAAVSKLDKLYETPTARTFKASKKGMDDMSNYLLKTKITDKNSMTIHRILASRGKEVESLKKVEKIRNDEMQVLLRGKATLGMY